jgi:fibronectin type 3 domain-containing protein
MPSPDAAVTAYQVWRGAADTGRFEKIGAPVRAPLELRDPGRPARRLSWYRVTALDAAGQESDPSPAALAEVRDLTPPAVPVGVVGTPDTGRLTLRWGRVAATDLRGYRVYRASTADGTFGLLSSSPQRDTVFVDPVPRRADHPFYYKVAAVDSSFNESAASAVVAVRPPDVTPPSAPLIQSVTAIEGGLVVRRLPNPEPDVVSYRLRYRVAGQGAWLEAGAAGDTLRGLQSRRYEVAVVAIDDAGNRSVPSRVKTVTPQGRVAAPDLRRVAFDRSNRAVVIEWRGAADAEVLVLRKEAGGAFRPIGSAGAVIPSAAGARDRVPRFVDRLVRRGRTYEYRISVRGSESAVRSVTIP